MIYQWIYLYLRWWTVDRLSPDPCCGGHHCIRIKRGSCLGLAGPWLAPTEACSPSVGRGALLAQR